MSVRVRTLCIDPDFNMTLGFRSIHILCRNYILIDAVFWGGGIILTLNYFIMYEKLVLVNVNVKRKY